MRRGRRAGDGPWRGALLLALVLAGCADVEPPALVELPAGAPIVFGDPVSTGAPSLLDAGVSGLAFEPYVVTDAAGRIYVADANRRAAVSRDGGRSFVPLAPPFDPLDGYPLGDVALLVQGERLWLAQTLQAEGSANDGLQLAFTDDQGLTWTREEPFTEGAPDRPWLADASGSLGLAWIEVERGTTFLARGDPSLGVDIGGGYGYGNLVSTSRGLALASCNGLFLEGVGVERYPSELSIILGCSHRVMLGVDPTGERLDLAFVGDDGRVCIGRSVGAVARWTPIHCEPAVPLVGTEKTPELWVASDASSTAVAWFEGTADGALELHVARVRDGRASKGVLDAGRIGSAEIPANTDFPAIALLPDGRIVVAWAPLVGEVHVAVER